MTAASQRLRALWRRRVGSGDPLTGLFTRAEFTRTLRTRLARPDGAAHTILLLQIDGLKTVNDLLGHAAGDQLLAAVGGRLRNRLPAGGSAARLDGAEFALVARTDSDDAFEIFARQLRDELQRPLALGSEVVHPVICLGTAPARPGEEVDAVLRAANVALAAARENGSGYQRYEPGLQSAVLTRSALEMALREAAPRRQLTVHYQPVVDLRDSRIVGAEALVRWEREVGVVVMPSEFIAAAEHSGAILAIGHFVLEEACFQVADWNRRYRAEDPLEIGVNLSVRQLASTDLVLEVSDVLRRSGLDPAALNLEVTESSVMEDAEEMIRRLQDLKATGLNISMDDFGTGYSSLSYLRRLPIDVLKIDRSFVDGIARTDEEWALAVAIVNLANSLGKRTLAEGVETPAQMAHLRALHCELAQGYLFGRPLPAAEFEEILRTGATA